MPYSVGEVAQILGIAPSALRYYESQGLLPSLERTSSGRRQFFDTDLEACRVIDCLKKAGLSIKDIKAFMDMVVEGDSTLAGRLALFRKRRAALSQEIEEMKTVLAVLDFKTWYYEQAVQAGSENTVRSLPPSEIPAEHRLAKDFLEGR